MVGSAAIKQGRSANRKHTYFFFLPNRDHTGKFEKIQGFYLWFSRPGSEVIKLFSCSTQWSKKVQLLIKGQMLKYRFFIL